MPNTPAFCDVSVELLSLVVGGQSTSPPGMAGGRWSGAPSPGSGGMAAPGMGIRDSMQGGAVAPSGGPTGGINTSPGGGGGGGGGGRGNQAGSAPLLY